MFCVNCGKSKVKEAKFCFNCGRDFQSECSQPLLDARNENITVEHPKKKLKSFEQYRSEKGSQWHKTVSGNKSKHKTRDQEQEEVFIFIGMLKLKDSELKVVRGKRLSLRVCKNDTPVAIRIKAEQKWKGYYPIFYNKDDFYDLTYENGDMIETLPGSTEPFKLHRYKEELGKDYKRITLFLCTQNDVRVKARISELNDSSNDSSDEYFAENESSTFQGELSVSPLPNKKHENFENEGGKVIHLPLKKHGNDNDEEEEDYGDEDVQKFFSNAEPSKTNTKINNTDDVHDLPELTLEEITILAHNCKTFEEAFKEKPKNLVLVQRNINKFWQTLFRNTTDFSTHATRVMFAGEIAVDNGGPFREFLRLSMKYFTEAPSMIFGPPMECLFTADTSSCFQKKYLFLGQLSALSIFTINRGPECLHPILVKSLFNVDTGKDVVIDDESFQQQLKEIDSGKHDALYNANINPFDKDAKSLYGLHYAIISRYAAISDFKAGINSISERILADYNIYSRYFHYRYNNIKAFDVLNLFLYKNDHELGSNSRIKEDDAMVELEFVIADIEKGKCGNLTLKDFLVFVTSFDRIPPFGFSKKIDIMFTSRNQLATSSTCDMNLTISTVNTRANILKALEEGISLNSI